MITIENETHILVLNKILRYFKFYCMDHEISVDALLSPFLGELCELVDKEAGKIRERNNKIIFEEDWGLIENNKIAFDRIPFVIALIPDFKSLDNSLKKELITILVYPYKIEEESLKKFL